LRAANFISVAVAACALALGCAAPQTFAAGVGGVRPHSTISASAAASQSDDHTFTHKEGGITFELPDGWKAEPDGDQLTVSSPDKSIAVVFWVTEDKDFDAATKALGEELGKQIKNLKFDGEAKGDTHNGMAHSYVSGSGQIEGQDILFRTDILMAKRPVIVLTFGSADNLQKHAEDYSKLVKSIRKVE